MSPITDPRGAQIAVLSSLLVGGLTLGRLDVPLWQPVVSLATAVAVQWVATRLLQLPRFDPRSAVITALGLTLLLRTTSPAAVALAAAVGIGAKFVVRVRGKHLFNPAMLGLVTTVTLSDAAWISPGQWGHDLLLAAMVAVAGLWVVRRAVRSELTLTFLGTWVALSFGRAAWLGDPVAIPLHNLQNGALIVFAFFMISDPKTAPDARGARIAHAALVAAAAAWWELGLYQESGPVRALFLCSLLVPVWDRLFPAARYAWTPEARGTHALHDAAAHPARRAA
jgi:Na+-transporting NADH:ubiquinone oxidoreductase subunit NqrB